MLGVASSASGKRNVSTPYEQLPPHRRAIALMKVEAKIMSRQVLTQLKKTLKHHAGQFGSGLYAGTSFPQSVVTQLAAIAKERELASGTLFVDICGAFDRAVESTLSEVEVVLPGLPESFEP
eukprot:4544181-Amphidinium_carterae.1